jgi:hypothetical protein
MDTTGIIYGGVIIAVFVAAIFGFRFLARRTPRSTLLIVAVVLFVGGGILSEGFGRFGDSVFRTEADRPARPGEVRIRALAGHQERILRGLAGMMRLTGTVGIVWGLVVMIRRRADTGSRPWQHEDSHRRPANEDTPPVREIESEPVGDTAGNEEEQAPTFTVMECPHCSTRVAPKSDGTCPACGQGMP